MDCKLPLLLIYAGYRLPYLFMQVIVYHTYLCRLQFTTIYICLQEKDLQMKLFCCECVNNNKTLKEGIYAMLQKYLLIAGKVTFMQCSHIFVSVFLAELVMVPSW